jgi:hypothetical protein
MVYRVNDTGANHLMGVRDTEAAAMELVRDLIAANGDDYVAELAVGYEWPDGSLGATLSGSELMDRANELALSPA